MHYITVAILGGWLIFSLVRTGADIMAWAVTLLLVFLFCGWFVLDSRCPKCRRLNALSHADDGPGVGEGVRQAHFECHYCGHRMSRRTPLGRCRSRKGNMKPS